MADAHTTNTINQDDQIPLNHLFYKAVEEKDLEKAAQLLEQGAEINVEGPGGRSILICTEDLKIIDWLIKNGADVNAQYDCMTALHFAANSNSVEKAAFLIQHGADINSRSNYHGNTPLHEAALYGHVEVFELLLDRGANSTLTNFLNQTVLHWAVGNNNLDNNKKIIDCLIKKGVDINAKDINGNTVLHFTSVPGREELSNFLLERGANPYILNDDQKTAQDLSCAQENYPSWADYILMPVLAGREWPKGITGEELCKGITGEESYTQSANDLVLPFDN